MSAVEEEEKEDVDVREEDDVEEEFKGIELVKVSLQGPSEVASQPRSRLWVFMFIVLLDAVSVFPSVLSQLEFSARK